MNGTFAPEWLQFVAFYLLTVAALKIAQYWANRNGETALGNGVGWFVPN
jgi:hypothetical protein